MLLSENICTQFYFTWVFQFSYFTLLHLILFICAVNYGNCYDKAAKTLIVCLFGNFASAQEQNVKAIRACCTAHIRSDYGHTSVARSVDVPVRVQKPLAHTDGAQMDRFTASDSLPSSCRWAVLPPVLQALCFVKSRVMINCAENFSEGLKWSFAAPVCLLNFLIFLCAERQMTALCGTALSSLSVILGV